MLILALNDQEVAPGFNRSKRFVDEAHHTNHQAWLFDGLDTTGKRLKLPIVFCDTLIRLVQALPDIGSKPIELRLILDLDWWHVADYGYTILEELAKRSMVSVTRVAVVTVTEANNSSRVKAKILAIAPGVQRVAVYDHASVQPGPVIRFLSEP